MYVASLNGEEIVAWGTGKAALEFLYVEDAAERIALAKGDFDPCQPQAGEVRMEGAVWEVGQKHSACSWLLPRRA